MAHGSWLMALKRRYQLKIEQSWSKVIRNVILPALYIGYPLVGNGVCKIEQVEHIKSNPEGFEGPEWIFA